MKPYVCLAGLLLAGLIHAGSAKAQELRDSLTFHASFDGTTKADVSLGDPQLYTADSVAREQLEPGLHVDGIRVENEGGRHGGCLLFSKKTKEVVMFRGAKNVAYSPDKFEGTFSFWMQLTPDEDLPPGYVDPLQVTDKTWNKASFFVDFTQENPRQFRMGVFSDYEFWNPDDRKWDDIPEVERPMVAVAKPPFKRSAWTHVAITFQGFNAKNGKGVAELFLDGQSQGQLKGPQRFSWEPDKVAIMLGIYYVGRLDDFAIFNRALTPEEIALILKQPNGIKSL